MKVINSDESDEWSDESDESSDESVMKVMKVMKSLIKSDESDESDENVLAIEIACQQKEFMIKAKPGLEPRTQNRRFFNPR